MPKLHIENGPDAGRTVSIESGATLGRDMACTVVLRDASVSRRHARIAFESGAWRVHDTQSRNGLAVQGARVEFADLRDGTTFLLGDVRMRFEGDRPSTPSIEADEIVLEGDWNAAAAAPVRASAPAQPAAPRAPEPSAARSFQSELDRTTVRPVAARSAPIEPPPPAAHAAPRGVQMRAPERGQGGAAATRAVLQYQKSEPRSGLAHVDLAQQPAWVKLALGAGAVLVFAALAWAAFQAASIVKRKSQPITTEDEALDAEPR